MERLTKRIQFPDGKEMIDFSNERVGEFLTDHAKGVKALFSALARYEELEEQGRLHIAPCKNGTEIFCITLGIYVDEEKYKHGFTEILCGEFNEDWFFTREEAEKTIKESGECEQE